MNWMVGDTELEANHRDDPVLGLHVCPKPVDDLNALEDVGKRSSCSLHHAGAPLRAESDVGGQLAPGAGTCHPMTDGSLADAVRFGHSALQPIFLLECPLGPSVFYPIGRRVAYAWQYTTAS